MPNKSLSRSSLLSFQKYSSLLAGNNPYIPFTSGYSLLASTELASPQAEVTFSNLGDFAADYDHLQIKVSTRSVLTSAGIAGLYLRFNGATTNYWWHRLYAQNSAATVNGSSSDTLIVAGITVKDTASANIFSGSVIDIFDAYNTSKRKVVRGFTGQAGATWYAGQHTGGWYDLSATSSLTLLTDGNFTANCSFYLYGWKAS